MPYVAEITLKQEIHIHAEEGIIRIYRIKAGDARKIGVDAPRGLKIEVVDAKEQDETNT